MQKKEEKKKTSVCESKPMTNTLQSFALSSLLLLLLLFPPLSLPPLSLFQACLQKQFHTVHRHNLPDQQSILSVCFCCLISSLPLRLISKHAAQILYRATLRINPRPLYTHKHTHKHTHTLSLSVTASWAHIHTHLIFSLPDAAGGDFARIMGY